MVPNELITELDVKTERMGSYVGISCVTMEIDVFVYDSRFVFFQVTGLYTRKETIKPYYQPK